MSHEFDVIVVGGGAAGFFSAINIAEKTPTLRIAIIEKSNQVLAKVKISGGGRCNLAHACFDPNELVKFYPSGKKELLGSFHRFGTRETINWFEEHGVKLTTEADGRMFPQTNSSQTVVDCLHKVFEKTNNKLFTQQAVVSVTKKDSAWEIKTAQDCFLAKKLVIAAGSNKIVWDILRSLGHNIVNPVPSLFTFKIDDRNINSLQGISVNVSVKIKDTKLKSLGALLFTHWGVSGPAILKLSAWGARTLFERDYKFTIIINWIDDRNHDEALEILTEAKQQNPKKTIAAKSVFGFSTENNNNAHIPNKLWEYLVDSAEITSETKWADLSKKQMQNLANKLTQTEFNVSGKYTFKEEFVTAGGIDLKEINFRTMESKLLPSLYFAGEVVDIDAVTGGFNFQNAWTTAYIAAESVATSPIR